MVGWLNWSEKRGFLPRITPVRPLGLPLLEAALPQGRRERRLNQGAKALHRRGVRRVLTASGLEDGDILKRWGLAPVDVLPLCRAMGGALALFLLDGVPVRQRRAALRGEEANGAAWALAQELCPQVGTLFLEFDRGEEELGAGLRARFGAAALHLGQGPSPQVSLELSPRSVPAGETLKLWGEPGLGGLTLALDGKSVPPGLPELPFLELLWETGRVSGRELRVLPANRP